MYTFTYNSTCIQWSVYKGVETVAHLFQITRFHYAYIYLHIYIFIYVYMYICTHNSTCIQGGQSGRAPLPHH